MIISQYQYWDTWISSDYMTSTIQLEVLSDGRKIFTLTMFSPYARSMANGDGIGHHMSFKDYGSIPVALREARKTGDDWIRR